MTIDRNRLITRWQRYVESESGSHDGEGIQALAAMVGRDLEEAGLTVEEAARSASGAPHLVAERPGTSDKQVLLLGHLDTVWPRGTLERNPFRMHDGNAYGPGVADMKGGLAVMVEGLSSAIGVDHSPGLRVVVTSDEELGSPTGREVVERAAADCDLCLVFEAGRPGGHFVDRRRGIAVFTMTVHGKTAHAGNDPQNGINAVDELAYQLLELEKLRDVEAGVYAQAGVIEGGTARQVVPDLATALIDVRGSTREGLDRVIRAINALPDKVHVAGAEVVVTGGETRPPFEPVEGTSELRSMVRRAAQRRGLTATFTAAGGGSDGNFTAAAGIPTLDGFGPVGHRLCSLEERAEIETTVERAGLFVELLELLARN